MTTTTLSIDRLSLKVESEKFQLGKITSERLVAVDKYEIPFEIAPSRVIELDIADPYLEALPETQKEEVQQLERLGNDLAKRRREAGAWKRQKGTAYKDQNGVLIEDKKVWGDPVSMQVLDDTLQNEAFKAWRTLMPSSVALAYLSDPLSFHDITNKDGQILAPLDEEARAWLTACSDAIGMRSRATVLSELVREYVRISKSSSCLKWMSVACGTALPTMKAAVHAGIKPDLMLVDIDESAMDATEQLAEEIGFEGNITKRRTSIFRESRMSELREELGHNGDRPRIVDMMGIFEYTGENLKKDPVTFLKSNYEMLYPGGRLIFGQMRKDRPNPDFTMGAIGWPYVEMRSPKEIMEIIVAAGINPKEVSLYMPNDGVYTVVSIDKPRAVPRALHPLESDF
jgi:hypothetical protein